MLGYPHLPPGAVQGCEAQLRSQDQRKGGGGGLGLGCKSKSKSGRNAFVDNKANDFCPHAFPR